MDFINQFVAQIRDLFSSMTPAARITSALLLGVIVVSLGYLFQGYANVSEELLFNGEILQPRDADRVEAAIAKAGLEVLPRQAGRIVVPRGKMSEYLAAVADEGALPANFHTLLEESLDSGLFESGEKSRARYKAVRERQLSMIVSMMEGVEDAQVLYDIREPSGFERADATATVSVLPAAGATLDGYRAKLIREAVAGAIGGLKPERVTLLNLKDGSQFSGGGEVPADDFDGTYFQERARYERMLKANIEDLLRYIPGAIVQVSAELDPMLGSELRSIKADGDLATIRERTDQSDVTSTQTEDRGEPGLRVQGPNGAPAEQAVAKNQTTDNSNTTETENFVPKTEELQRLSGLAPKNVHASIAIPSEYLVKVWRATDPNAKPDDKPDASQLQPIESDITLKIKTGVSRLFPREFAEKNLDNVVVTVLQSLAPDPIEPPTMAKEGLLWASRNSGSLMMGGMAIVCLAMLRSMMKSIPATDKNVAFSLPELTVVPSTDSSPARSGERNDASKKEGLRPKLRLKKGPTLRDDLTELVREDPDGAAAILRTWIGNAS